MTNLRVLPPPSGPLLTCTVFGRTYTGVAGTPQDVPIDDAHALAANGWTVLGMVGATAARPANPGTPGVPFFIDTTIGAPIWWDGATWRDYAGNSV